jgi:predicted Fe-Mo cluster-binding NifX family protein
MKIAVASIGKELNSHLDLRFGRAEYFLVVDAHTLEYSVIDNKINAGLAHGAGTKVAKMLVDLGVDIVICGNCGPKAFGILTQSNIKVVIEAQGRVIEAISHYKSRRLRPAYAASVGCHLGRGDNNSKR